MGCNSGSPPGLTKDLDVLNFLLGRGRTPICGYVLLIQHLLVEPDRVATRGLIFCGCPPPAPAAATSSCDSCGEHPSVLNTAERAQITQWNEYGMTCESCAGNDRRAQ